MWEKVINRLLTVKSIVTLTLTAVFAFLSATGRIQADAFQDIFYIIIETVYTPSPATCSKAIREGVRRQNLGLPAEHSCICKKSQEGTADFLAIVYYDNSYLR